jgi:tRNA (Thr-GGU) A37 N-methylase
MKTIGRHNTMKVKRGERKGIKSQRTALVRASISFLPDFYEALEQIKQQKKVSLAWVVRDAAEKYVVKFRSGK